MSVAVAVPSHRSWQPSMGIAFASMCACSTASGTKLVILSVEGTEIVKARNSLAQQSLDLKAEWLLFVDDDMLFPPEILQSLLRHNKDIVGILCSQRALPYAQIGRLKVPQDSGLAEAEFLGAGILLIKTSVFDRLRRPWFSCKDDLSEDLYFMNQAKNAGIRIWCDLDLSLKIGHIGTQVFTLNKAKALAQMERFR